MNELVKRIFLEVIPEAGQGFNGELRRDETDRWDSLTHLRLITALEAELKCTFSMDDIQRMDSFSAVADIAMAHAQANGRGG